MSRPTSAPLADPEDPEQHEHGGASSTASRAQNFAWAMSLRMPLSNSASANRRFNRMFPTSSSVSRFASLASSPYWSTTGDRSPQRHRVGADFRCVGARGEDPIRLVEFPHPLLRGGATYVWSRWSGLSTHYRGPQDSHSTWTTLRGSGHRRLRRLAIRVKTVCLRVRLRFGIITILVLQAHFGPVLLDEVAND